MSDFSNDKEIYDFILEMFNPWGQGSYEPVYGGAQEALDLRQSNPFGQYQEGQEVESVTSWGYTDLRLHKEWNEFSFCVEVGFTVDVEAASEDSAKDFVLRNLSKCFIFEDSTSGDQVKIKNVKIDSIVKIKKRGVFQAWIQKMFFMKSESF
jgi:hypothetical protein